MRRHVSKILAIVLMMTMMMSSVSFGATNKLAAENEFSYVSTYENLWNNGVESAKFYFLKSYFSGDATKYNKHLATASMALNMAAGTTDDEYIIELFNQLGCPHPCSKEYGIGTLNSIGVAYATKDLGDNTVLIPVVVRGSGYGIEWAQNFCAGLSGNGEGFDKPSEKVFNYIKTVADGLLEQHKEVKIWITGFSRGGAVANLAAKKLSDSYDKKNVFAYTYEAPKGANPPDDEYTNIHNVVNVNDGIALVMPDYMGFGRHGTDIAIGDGNQEEMLEMFGKISSCRSGLITPDQFKWGKFKLNVDLNSPHLISDVIKILKGGDIYTKEACEGPAEPIDFWNLVLKRLRKQIPTRKYYVESKIQDGFMNLMYLVKGMTTNQKKNLKNAVLDTETILSFVGTPNLVKSLLAVQDGRVPKLSDAQYKRMADNIYKAIANKMDELADEAGETSWKFNDNQKQAALGVCEYLLKPAIALLADDYNDNHQLVGTIMINNNLEALKQNHYYEVNMAWLMTQDSYYKGSEPTADNYQDFDQALASVTKTDITKMCSLKKGFEVQWEQQSEDLDGYQIQYSTDKTFSDVTKISIKDRTVTNQKVTNLKPWRRYYVRVRCFRVVDGVRFYGGWSTTKSRITRLLRGRG